MDKVAIIGSTGSVGKNTLKVIQNNPERFKVVALAARKNIRLLAEQADIFRPKIIAVWDKDKAELLQQRLRGKKIKVLSGEEGLEAVATLANCNKVVFSLSGICGLKPLLSAIRAKKHIAIANKELLVIAGTLIKKEVEIHKVPFVPIDSEHSAIFQCLEGHQHGDVRKIILTASGGPFVDTPMSKFRTITPKQALKHPRWKMGKKISIDSATMMNKGLEVIEAVRLYQVPVQKVDVIVHRQSIVHSLIEYVDGNMLAQLSETDMYFPISYALSYPDRLPYKRKRLRLDTIGNLSFEIVDKKKFPCLGLAYSAARAGGTMTTVLNAANEVAVDLFLRNKVLFSAIPTLIKTVMTKHSVIDDPSLDDILSTDAWAREEVLSLC